MAMTDRQLSYDQYEIHKQTFKLLGGAFRIYSPSGELLLYANQKAFRLREDIRFYSDESMQTESLLIQARHIIDWSAAYDIVEMPSEKKLGALKRKGLVSMVQDEWVVMDAEDHEIGTVREDSLILGLIRRFVTNLVPQTFHMEIDGIPVGTFKQNFNPFTLRLAVDFSGDATHVLDRRLGLAAGVLLCAVEGRQH